MVGVLPRQDCSLSFPQTQVCTLIKHSINRNSTDLVYARPFYRWYQIPKVNIHLAPTTKSANIKKLPQLRVPDSSRRVCISPSCNTYVVPYAYLNCPGLPPAGLPFKHRDKILGISPSHSADHSLPLGLSD